MNDPTRPRFFATPSRFGAWLAKNHLRARELWVGFYKRETGKPSITWPESVDEALCVGWIDGIRKRIDDESYVIRFTPRREKSKWSAINIARMKQLIDERRVLPAGLAAFERRPSGPGSSYELPPAARLEAREEKMFRAAGKAWSFFESQPPSYRRMAIWWIVSAKREETRLKRLKKLMDDSHEGKRI